MRRGLNLSKHSYSSGLLQILSGKSGISMPLKSLLILSSALFGLFLLTSCTTTKSSITEINQDFGSISNRMIVYQENQSQARERQQKALMQIRDMIEQANPGIKTREMVFNSPSDISEEKNTASVAVEPKYVTENIESSGIDANQQESVTLFKKACEKYNNKQFELAAEDFIFAYSYAHDVKLKAISLYWAGECHYQNREWQKAIQCFSRFENAYPDHSMAPKAILQKGCAYINSGKITEGKEALFILLENHPLSQEAPMARERLRELGVL